MLKDRKTVTVRRRSRPVSLAPGHDRELRRVAIIASASGNGKTTLGRALAKRLGVRFVELDALVHGPGWTKDA
jgi:SpoVK/Ycf46/Vps4 family AAA+-type ATPase